MKERIWRVLRQFSEFLRPSGSLTEQSIASGVWMGAMNFLGRGLQLLMVLVLGRLLSPSQFGVMGIALLAMGALNRFVRLGIDSALIYNEDENVDPYLNTVWVLRLLRGGLIAGIVVLSAPLLAGVFDTPQVRAVLPVMAVAPLLEGGRNPGIVYFRKNLEYDKRFVYELSAAAVQFVLAVGYALVSPTVWALVVGYLSTSLVKFVGSYLLHGYRPWPVFDVDRAKEIVDYGKWIFGGSAIGFVHDNGDDAFVGWLLGATFLGYYQMAFRFSNAPVTEITQVITDVAFPAYSKLQDNLAALRTGFFRVVQLSTFVATPMSIGIATIAPTFVEAFLGQQWLPMVVPMQILALYAVWRSFGSTFGAVWKAVGRPDYLTKLQGLGTLLIAVFIYPASAAYGITGTAFVIFATSVFIMMPIDAYVTVRELDTSMWRLFSEFGYPVTASAFMGVAVVGTARTLALDWPMLEFVVLVLVGVVSYLLAVAVLEYRFEWGIRSELRAIRRAL